MSTGQRRSCGASKTDPRVSVCCDHCGAKLDSLLPSQIENCFKKNAEWQRATLRDQGTTGKVLPPTATISETKQIAEDFIAACKANNLGKVREYLDSEMGPVLVNSEAPYSKKTPLFIAAKNSYLELAMLLVEYGALVETSNCAGEHPIYIAARSGSVEMVRFLLDNGAFSGAEKSASTGETMQHGSKLVFIAINQVSVEMVKLLIERIPSSVTFMEHGGTPLHWAARRGSVEIAKLLIENGASINSETSSGLTPLHVAAANKGTLDMMMFLLEQGASVNHTNHHGEIPLHVAISRFVSDASSSEARAEELIRMTKLLVACGSSVNTTNRNGSTPLHLAVKAGLAELTCVLVENGALVDQPTATGATALHLASRMGKVAVARCLIEKGASVNVSDIHGDTPLHYAAEAGLPAHLRSGARNGTLVEGPVATANRRVWEAGPLEVLSILIKSGTEVNVQNAQGQTALHIAVESDSFPIVRALLENGGLVTIKDRKGQTPPSVGRTRGPSPLTSWLERIEFFTAMASGQEIRRFRSTLRILSKDILMMLPTYFEEDDPYYGGDLL